MKRIFTALFFSSILAFSTPSMAQSRNTTLLGRFDRYSGYNDIWAYTAKNGKEYAFLGSAGGVSIIDCSKPSSPVERAYIRGTGSSTWRDIKVFGNYAYCVTERRGEGMMIVDISNPDAPKLVTRWDAVGYSHAHNIAMDFERGHAYLTGTSGGIHVLDVKSNPTNPPRIGQLTSPYVHDLSIHNGIAFLSEQNYPSLRIYDVSKLPTWNFLSNTRTPGSQVSHNTWPNYDNTLCVTTNETAGGPVGIFDTSNLKAPKLLSTWTAGPSNAIPHNAYLKDGVCHASYYTEGYRSVDISDPTKPVEVAYYDTYGGSSGGYNGMWGTLPPLASGNVYCSDRFTGLWIFKPKSTAAYYGNGTPGTGNVRPTIRMHGAGYLGNKSFGINLTEAKPSSVALLLLGAAKIDLNAMGLNLLVNVANPGGVIVSVPTSASGVAKIGLPVPADTKLNGAVLYAQWLVVDSGSASPLKLSASQGMQFELFTR